MHNSKGLENLQSHRVHRMVGNVVTYVVAIAWFGLQDVTLGRVGRGVSRPVRLGWAGNGRVGTVLGLALSRSWLRFGGGRGVGGRACRACGGVNSGVGVAFVATRGAVLHRT